MPAIRASGGTSVTSEVSIESKSAFTTAGATVGTTETTIVVPIGTKAFRLHTKKGSSAVLTVSSLITGTSNALTSFDIGMGSIWSEELLTGNGALTIYIKSNKAATDVQLLYWT